MLTSFISAGWLRHTIQIVDPTIAGGQDSLGGPVSGQQNPTLVATVRAKIEFLGAHQLYAAQQLVSQVTHRITIRYRTWITAKLEVVFRERVFSVQAVEDPDERKRILVLLCLERNDSVGQSVTVAP
jgi:SPP1 family predicted phage head-tail adaptor